MFFDRTHSTKVDIDRVPYVIYIEFFLLIFEFFDVNHRSFRLFHMKYDLRCNPRSNNRVGLIQESWGGSSLLWNKKLEMILTP